MPIPILVPLTSVSAMIPLSPTLLSLKNVQYGSAVSFAGYLECLYQCYPMLRPYLQLTVLIKRLTLNRFPLKCSSLTWLYQGLSMAPMNVGIPGRTAFGRMVDTLADIAWHPGLGAGFVG